MSKVKTLITDNAALLAVEHKGGGVLEFTDDSVKAALKDLGLEADTVKAVFDGVDTLVQSMTYKFGEASTELAKKDPSIEQTSVAVNIHKRAEFGATWQRSAEVSAGNFGENKGETKTVYGRITPKFNTVFTKNAGQNKVIRDHWAEAGAAAFGK